MIVLFESTHLKCVHELQLYCLEDVAWSLETLTKTTQEPLVEGGVLILHGNVEGFVLWRCVAQEGEILSIGVGPSCRRRGWGRQLAVYALEHLRKKNVEEVYLDVAEDNLPAQNLYKTLGFCWVGQRAKYYKTAEGSYKKGYIFRKK